MPGDYNLSRQSYPHLMEDTKLMVSARIEHDCWRGVFLFKLFNDNWVSIGLYDNCLAFNDLKQEIVGIKDKTDNRYVRVRAPSQLILVAQAAEFNRTQRMVLYDFIYASKLLSTESLSELNTVNYCTSSK